MKIRVLALILALNLTAAAQNTYKISLSNVYVNPSVRFKVNRVIDGRRNKVNIGWVQPGGWASKMKIAVLDGPLEQEMQDLLMRSSLISSEIQGRIVRLTRFAIGEVRSKDNLFKTIRAEVAFDLFQMWNLDSCYYLGSTIGRSEQSAVSASSMHSDNIGRALEDAIQNVVIKAQANSPVRFAIEDLTLEDFSHRDPESVAILNADQYPDGVFLSFEEFLENKPSVTSNYDVKIGSNVKLWRLDDEGKRERVTDGIYALSKSNVLYILFNEEFYPLRRGSGSFHFLGPSMSDPSGLGKNWIAWGVVGAGIAATAKSLKTHYRIDMDTGGFVEMGTTR